MRQDYKKQEMETIEKNKWKWEDKKIHFFTLCHPFFLLFTSLLANMRHLLLCMCVLFFLPPSSAHRFFRETVTWRKTQKIKTLFFLFYIFFLFFPGPFPTAEAPRTHTHTLTLLASRAAPVFPPCSRREKIFSRQATLENDCSTVFSRSSPFFLRPRKIWMFHRHYSTHDR